jgi:hypothetical protein
MRLIVRKHFISITESLQFPPKSGRRDHRMHAVNLANDTTPRRDWGSGKTPWDPIQCGTEGSPICLPSFECIGIGSAPRISGCPSGNESPRGITVTGWRRSPIRPCAGRDHGGHWSLCWFSATDDRFQEHPRKIARAIRIQACDSLRMIIVQAQGFVRMPIPHRGRVALE